MNKAVNTDWHPENNCLLTIEVNMNIIAHEVNGVAVQQRTIDGFINGTAMCVAHGKDISDWLKTDDTWELVVALADDLGIQPVEPKNHKSGNSVFTRVSVTYPTLVVVKRGSPETGGGTWLAPDLAIQLAQWCNKVFAIQVSRWVRDWMINGQNPIQNQVQERQTLEKPLVVLPEQRAKSVFDFALTILSRSSRMTDELQDIYALRAVEAQIPECSGMTNLLIGAIQESTATVERHLSPTELGSLLAKQLGLEKPVQASAVNQALESAGLQWKEVVIKTDKHTGKERKKNVWHLTEAGIQYGVVVLDKAFGHDKTVECVRWLPDVLKVIKLS